MSDLSTPPTTQQFTPAQLTIINLLGDGHSQAAVARASGLSESRISQLMSEQAFADAVADRRFAKLQKYDEIDKNYDELELEAQQKLKKALPLISITSPDKLLKAIQVLNSAKRRGHDVDPSQTINHHHVVNLTLPTEVLTRFVTAPQTNEVVEIDGKPLVTVSPTRIADNHVHRKAREDGHPVQTRPISLPTFRAGQTVSASDLE